MDAKNSPDGNQSRQCMGATTMWIVAAPTEAIAAHRADNWLSVLIASLAVTA